MTLLKLATILLVCVISTDLIAVVFSRSQEPLVRRTSSGKPYYFVESPTSHSVKESLYETVVPLIYEFKTPNWSDPINLIGYTCTGDDYETDGYSCPVLWYWLTQVRDELQKDIFVSSLRIQDNSGIIPRDLDLCDSMTGYFEGQYLSPSVRESFYTEIQTNCQNNRTVRLPISTEYVADNIDQPYRTMREKFFDEYYNLQTPINRTNDAMYLNARYNFYSSGLFHYYTEAQRWKDALQDCRSRRIPRSLIAPSSLTQNIQNISDNFATPNGYSLFFPTDKISAYYRNEFELADCAFTDDSLIVTLLIPLSSVKKSVRKVTMFPVPTRENMDSSLCFMDALKNEEILLLSKSGNDDDDDSDSRTQMAVPIAELDCIGSSASQSLCKVNPSYRSTWPVRKSCAQAIIDGSDEDEVCGWSCYPSKLFRYPMIRHISSDRFLVVGDPLKREIKVECPLYQKEEVLEVPSSGIVELTLPCDCQITVHKNEVYKAGSRCGSELILHPIDYPFVAKTSE